MDEVGSLVSMLEKERLIILQKENHSVGRFLLVGFTPGVQRDYQHLCDVLTNMHHQFPESFPFI